MLGEGGGLLPAASNIPGNWYLPHLEREGIPQWSYRMPQEQLGPHSDCPPGELWALSVLGGCSYGLDLSKGSQDFR